MFRGNIKHANENEIQAIGRKLDKKLRKFGNQSEIEEFSVQSEIKAESLYKKAIRKARIITNSSKNISLESKNLEDFKKKSVIYESKEDLEVQIEELTNFNTKIKDSIIILKKKQFELLYEIKSLEKWI